MERDVLMGAFPLHRRAGREALAILLAVHMTILAGGCGKQGSTPPRQGEFSQGEEAASAGIGGGALPDQIEHVVQAGGDLSVIVVPSSPSRIAPPSVSVRAQPGQSAEIKRVTWIVNGVEQSDGNLLDPSLFERGDRIKAVVALRTGADEMVIETPEVRAENALPAVAGVRIDPRAPTTGSTVRAVVDARDLDGDPLTHRYQWYVDRVPVPGDGETLSLRGVRKGSSVHVRVTPNDGFAEGAWKYSPVHEIVNAPPVVKNDLPTKVPPSRVLTHTIVAEDPDGDPLTYVLDRGTEGMSLDGPMLTWKISDGDLGRSAEVVIRISDNQGGETVLTMNLTPNTP